MIELYVIISTILMVVGWCLYFDKRDEVEKIKELKEHNQKIKTREKYLKEHKLYTGTIENNKRRTTNGRAANKSKSN